jgi:hypothetical protein
MFKQIDDDEYYTAAELEKLVNGRVDRRHITRNARRNRLRAHKWGKSWQILGSDFKKYIASTVNKCPEPQPLPNLSSMAPIRNTAPGKRKA